jgi:hypothetical protein
MTFRTRAFDTTKECTLRGDLSSVPGIAFDARDEQMQCAGLARLDVAQSPERGACHW